MKATLDRRPFHEALTIALRATNSRSSLPVCSHVLLRAGAESLSLFATDLESGCEITLPARSLEPGDLCLPAQLLTSVLGTLPEGKLTLTGDANSAELKAGRSRFKLAVLTDEQFPVLPEVTGEAGFSLPEATFVQCLREVDKAYCNDNTRPLLCSVHVKRDGDRLLFAATDTHRLAVTERPVTGAGDDFAVLIPSDVVALLLAALTANGTRQVRVRIDDKAAEFVIEGQRILTRLVQGTFPNYERLIPTEFAGTATVTRADLQSALRRLDVLARSQMHRVLLSAGERALRLEVPGSDLGTAEEEIEAGFTGSFTLFGISISYLLDSLVAMETEAVVIERPEAAEIALVRPVPAEGYFNLIALLRST